MATSARIPAELPEAPVITVSQLNDRLNAAVQSNTSFRDVQISGRLARWKYFAPQDAYYFTVEDKTAASKIEGVLFNAKDKKLPDGIKESMEVVVRGSVEIYAKGGCHRIRTSAIREDGVATVRDEFRELYERLEKAGYFRQKRPIPAVPKKICIITSDTGAVQHDFFTNIERRFPLVEILFIPAVVQGESAERSLISAIEKANTTDADLIIFGRGGGSPQELSVFNSVPLADAILASRIPTISAVGHQPDFSISDFVADRRAPTPSTAAEYAVPDIRELLAALDKEKRLITVSLHRVFDSKVIAVERISGKLRERSPLQRLGDNSGKLTKLSEKIGMQMNRLIEIKSARTEEIGKSISARVHDTLEQRGRTVAHLAEMIEAVSPMNVLRRGFSITVGEGGVVRSAEDVKNGDRLTIKVADGSINAVVESTEKEQNYGF
ncbi:MAG: exodeoxyribonuclease VII large subunit [Ruminiclostridium sp.]|nr:exodeoxyribonuclease VII large subunit [Ruminiclostridium sp.]